MIKPMTHNKNGIVHFTDSIRFLFEIIFFANLMIALMFVSIAARMRWDSLVRRLMRLSAKLLLKIRCGRHKIEMMEIEESVEKAGKLSGKSQGVNPN